MGRGKAIYGSSVLSPLLPPSSNLWHCFIGSRGRGCQETFWCQKGRNNREGVLLATVFKVASFPCSFFSCDLAGARAVVAGALLPRGSRLTGGSREGVGQPVFLPLVSALRRPQSGCARGVYQAAGEGLPVPLALQPVPGLHLLPGACAEHTPSVPSPCPPGCGTLLGRCSAGPQPRFCVVSPCFPCLALHFSAVLDWLSEP